jgi:hypothetical protein
MSCDKTPSRKHLEKQMRAMEVVLRANGLLRRIGLGSEQLEKTGAALFESRAKMEELNEAVGRFNRYFSKEGWLAYAHMNTDVIKQAVSAVESNGLEAATDVLIDYYSPDLLGERLFFLIGVEELRIRMRFVDYAFADYKAGRYYAVVPLLLMVIDGSVNDAVGKGFHAESLELDVWDSITAADGAINDIKDIFQRSRKKTRTEEISVPYRHGILHGMDLGYDNVIVAAKCWSMLFVLSDWLRDKKTESERRDKFAERTRVPTLCELASKLDANERAKAAIESWQPRNNTDAIIAAINAGQPAEIGSPEEAVLAFLSAWSRRNYGEMAALYSGLINDGSRAVVGQIRTLFHAFSPTSWSVTRLEDSATAITELDVVLTGPDGQCESRTFRMIYEDGSGEAMTRGEEGGVWRIVSIRS